MMRNGLCQADSLPHAFAVTRDFAPRDLRHARAVQRLVGQFGGLLRAKSVQAQRPVDKIVAVRSGREGVKLRAISNLAEEFDRLARREPEDVNRALGRFDQARQQVHQRRLAGTVRAHEAGNSRLERKTHFIDAEHFSVELGDVVEHDLARVWRHPFTVSRARNRTLRMKSESRHTAINTPQAAQTGTPIQSTEPSSPVSSRKPFARISRNRYEKLSNCPQYVPMIALKDRKSTRLNSSHPSISYAVFCLKKKN